MMAGSKNSKAEKIHINMKCGYRTIQAKWMSIPDPHNKNAPDSSIKTKQYKTSTANDQEHNKVESTKQKKAEAKILL